MGTTCTYFSFYYENKLYSTSNLDFSIPNTHLYMSATIIQNPIFVWFRNDLRIHDNPCLYAAIQQGKVQPIYLIDPRMFQSTSFGLPRMGIHRRRFLRESLENLRSQLHSIGLDLLILNAMPEELFPNLLKALPKAKLFFSYEYAYEETQIEEALAHQLTSSRWKGFWSGTLIDPENLPFTLESLPNGFTSFRKKVEKYTEIPEPIATPTQANRLQKCDWGEDPSALSVFAELESIDSQLQSIETIGCTPINPIAHLADELDLHGAQWEMLFKGGEEAGLARLEYYLWETDLVATYKKTRNRLVGTDYSTKFSPWLANGSLSARMIASEIHIYERQRIKNDSTYWVIFELLWRDFFRFAAYKYGYKWFSKGGIQSNVRKYQNNKDYFEAWISGRTGFSFVDANMRELATTGFMSNRGRQNIASFFTQNMSMDWRWGAEYFESMLLDYDPASNYGNWMYNATLGHDPRNRFFNIELQADRYDSSGEYVMLWCKELIKVPFRFRHRPYLYDQSMFVPPIIDLEKSYEEIRRRE